MYNWDFSEKKAETSPSTPNKSFAKFIYYKFKMVNYENLIASYISSYFNPISYTGAH